MSPISFRDLLVLPVLIPLVVGLIKFKTADTTGRLFVFFLLIGLTTDLTMGILIHASQGQHLMKIFNVYSLVESLFFFWFLQKTALSKAIYRIAMICLIGTSPIWAICFVLPSEIGALDFLPKASFDTAYEVVVSFLAGYSLLQRAEKGQSLISSHLFWLTLGVFFYCFCTFYIMSFLDSMFLKKIWFINNIINITSYLFYAIGFYAIRPEAPHE